jgi:ribosome-binding factor A
MGDETKQNLCLKGLQSSAGFLQSKVGKRIDTRYTPKIQFSLDKGMQHAMAVTRILEEVLPQENEELSDDESFDNAEAETFAENQDEQV